MNPVLIMSDLIEVVFSLLDQYGYAIISIMILLECAGLPLPGETMLLAGSAYASTGHLNIYLVILTASISAAVGDAGGYWVGRKFGRRILGSKNRFFIHISTRLQKVESFYKRFGDPVVFFGRFVTILRMYVALFAGIGKMPYYKFALYNVSGGILWATTFGIIGFIFGKNLSFVEKLSNELGWVVAAAILFFFFFLVLRRYIIKRVNFERIGKPFDKPVQKILSFIQKNQFLPKLRRSLTYKQYLGLHLATGLIIAIIGMTFFHVIAESVIFQNHIVNIDMKIACTVENWHTPFATAFFVSVTDLGTWGVFITVVILSYLFIKQKLWYHLFIWLTASLGADFIDIVIKEIIKRPRPPLPHLVHVWGYSFPSGHATVSMVTYGMLAYFSILNTKGWSTRISVIFSALIVICFIGFSRIYLEVHYFSDIIGGYTAGMIWLGACISAMEYVRHVKRM